MIPQNTVHIVHLLVGLTLWVSCAVFGVNLTQLLAVPKDMGNVDKRNIMQLHQIFDLHQLLVPLQVHPRK